MGLKFFQFTVFAYFIFSFAGAAHAATLYISPNQGTHSPGSVFSASVYVTSADRAMNAVSGVISFPANILEVVSVAKTGSVLELWVQEPSFSNSAGTVSFEGIALNPGFIGSAGKVATINFKASRPGSASLSFSSGSVLANDGQGTNILEKMSGAQLNIKDTSAAEVQQPTVQQDIPAPAPGTPSAPNINSPTHPNSESWYSKNTAVFTWETPEDITAVRLLYGTIENIAPTIYYDSPISQKTIEDVPDGTYWFHARLRNRAGWGETAHFKFNVDTGDPTLSVNEAGYADDAKTRKQFAVKADDRVSGISHYEITIDDRDAVRWDNTDSGVYTTPVLRKGEHTMVVKVFDNARNVAKESISFQTEGYSLKWFSGLSQYGLGKIIGIIAAIIIFFGLVISRTFRNLLVAMLLFPIRFTARKVCNICRIGKKHKRRK